jgi:hypothetical protein
VKIKNIYLALKDQLPWTRLVRNLWKGHVFGLFHKRSHENANGKPKVMYNTKVSAQKAAAAMAKKRGVYFSNYKCMRCDGYHIGKNSENKGEGSVMGNGIPG